MRLLVLLSSLLFSTLSFSETNIKSYERPNSISTHISNTTNEKNIHNDRSENENSFENLFQGCSIRLNDRYLPIRSFEKITLSSESVFLHFSNVAKIKFEISSAQRSPFLIQLSKQKEHCLKRVREYRRHPAY